MRQNYKKFSIIFFLGISSGLPLALILSTLKALLVDNGFDLKTIGFFSLVSLPYTLKIFFAPIIDSCKIPILTKRLGQRKSWIILTQILLAISISWLGVAGMLGNLAAIATLSLMTAFFSASQDIVIDGYRIELLAKEDQGLASGFYIYGYRIGMLISGAGALALADIVYWDAVFFIMAACMISAALITTIADETRKNFERKSQDLTSWFKEAVVEPLVDFTKRERWLVIFAFVISFKLCDAFAGNLTLPFLLDIGFSKIQVASIVKTFGLFATLFGVFCGGVLVKKIGIYKTLWIATIAQMVSNLAFSYLATVGSEINALYFVIFIENFSGGIGDAVFVAYLSSLCNLAFSATQYALLASLATLARSVLSSSGGIFAANLGWYNFFIVSASLAIPALIFLFFINKKQSLRSLQK